MREYRFLTTWVLDAPRERVWAAIHDSESWPGWWKGVERVVEITPGDEDGIGQIGRYTWKSKLPYELTFDMRTTGKEPPHLLEGEASGELAGIGRWRLFEHDDAAGAGPVTAVVYEWNVATTKQWMNLLSPIAKPVFAWNHDWVMGHGGEGLARLLGCHLLASD